MEVEKGKKIGLILVLFGLFIPIVLLPFTKNYYPMLGIIKNIQDMYVLIYEDKIPIFDWEDNPVKVKYYTKEEINGITFAFPYDITNEDTAIARKYALKQPPPPPGLKGNYIVKLDRWESLPHFLFYKYIFSFGITLMFIGLTVYVHSTTKRQKQNGRKD